MIAHWVTTRAWMLLSAATRCIALLGLVAMLDRFSACRRRPRRAQIADEVQLGRLPADTRVPCRGRP
jgi:hypothetical protein